MVFKGIGLFVKKDYFLLNKRKTSTGDWEEVPSRFTLVTL
jgi:hypothetical protein